MKNLLPNKYREKLIEATIPGVIASAWTKELLLEFIEDEASKNFAILGGDVVSIENLKMKYTYDSWSIDKRKTGESFNDYCKRGSVAAKEYVSKYPIKNNILFIPVITSEVTAGM